MTTAQHPSAEQKQTRPVQFLPIGEQGSMPAPLIRVTTCGLMTIEVVEEIVSLEPPQARYVSLTPEQLHGRGTVPAFMLLKLLLNRHERFATREWLIEQFCRDGELFSNVRIDNIVSQLRGLLCPPVYRDLRKQIVAHVRGSSGDGYQLAPHPLVWVDQDALTWNVEQAARMERFGDQALPFWERAYELARRGPYLPDERYADWASFRREQVASQLRQSVLALARLYQVQHGPAGEEEAALLLRTYWLEHQREEDALRPLMELLGRRECMHEALGYYEQLCNLLQEDERKPDSQTQDVAAYLRTKQVQRRSVRSFSAPKPTSLFSAMESSFSPFSEDEQRIIRTKLDPGDLGLNHSRRQVLHGMVATAYTLLAFSPYTLLQPEKQERFVAMMSDTSFLTQNILEDLEEITKRYWRLSANLSSSLQNGILGHFQQIVHLLNAPQTATVYQELYSLASEAAQLLGKMLFDLCDYPLALSYYTFAVKAALEAHNSDLRAAALGRMGLLLLSSGQPQRALSCLQEIRGSSLKSQKMLSWCAAIEAEAYSYLGELSPCLNALAKARNIPDAFVEDDPYATGFTISRFASYEGSCYLRLNQPKRALPVLQQAVELLDPGAVRKRARLLTYLGKAHVSLGDEEQACDYAYQALSLTQQTQSLDVLQHIQMLSNELTITKMTPHLQSLQVSIQETRIAIVHAGEYHG